MLGTERSAQIEARLAKDAYDTEAWQMLLAEAQNVGTEEQHRDAFDRFLEQFPTSGRHWALYVEFELRHGRTDLAEAIFARSLREVLSVDLWKSYLAYVQRNNEHGGNEGRQIVLKAFETALQYIGMDKDAGGIWSDYIAFIKAGETSSTYEEQQKMDATRRAYRRVIAIPVMNVEALWRDYDAFENGLSRMTAKKFLAEQSPIYMTARTAARELKQLSEPLQRGSLPCPPRWSDKEMSQLAAWRRYLDWEKSDPLKIEDAAARYARISFAYKQAMMVLRFYPEVWFQAASFALEHSRNEEAIQILKSAIDIMPHSFLVNFALAEIYEERKQVAEARALYEKFLDQLSDDIAKMNESMTAEIAAFEAQHQRGGNIDGGGGADMATSSTTDAFGETDGEEREEARRLRGYTLAAIVMMRFVRRAEGIKVARQVFSRTRKSPHITYHLFVASALMEYYCSKEAAIAGRVFELGLKSFSDPDYIREYLDYLIRTNDNNNARALFERTINMMPADRAQDVWRLFLDYTCDYEELTNAKEVEKRYLAAYPQGKQGSMILIIIINGY
ncbi:hypothetical protein SYNPS1DRAFT_16123 [Syncephalis pseudoplumigaleata]|uniref:Suppressor of forked domain-containing protein n=1 Tax=Syncephalis pseudoplumigaleata TaxID=1712513 RepID=A0A4P9YYL0_9FUNG|nr:hypothetical protein SYNPS1DRAFT_16123 [Syncephalis pseudoplumigaleata]|eukprot:RKP25134.1 hypothetical protein SYNPS1DRAFT_16123 [Syncephalis pseudoplumigaleata]